MKINIKIHEIEFQAGNGEELEYNFHDRIKIKKSFERELNRLLSQGSGNTRVSPFEGILANKFVYDMQSSEKLKFLTEIDGGVLSYAAGYYRDPSLIGKKLADSICSTLTDLDRSKIVM